MIVNIKRKDLLAQAKKVARASTGVNTIKELAGILFEADDRSGIVRMTATNLEVSIKSTMPAAVDRGGEAVIDAKYFLGILERLPGESIYMELHNNGVLHFNSGQTNYDISVLDRKRFPVVEIPYPGNTVSVKGLRSLIARSVFAAAPSSTGKPVMSCIKLDFNEAGLRAIGCNGFCAVQTQGDPDGKGSISLLIPATSLKLLASIAGDNDVLEAGVTGSGGSAKSVVFSDGTTTFSARLVDGVYIDTDTLFKNLTPAATAKTDADKLRKALDHVLGIASTKDRIEISFAENNLLLRCQNDNGSITCELGAEIALATDEVYYFAPDNLMNCAKALKGSVTLNFTKDKLLEIQSDSIRFMQIAARPAEAKQPKPIKAPRKKAAA
jgi:DNA polymerase-3 subunit beta